MKTVGQRITHFRESVLGLTQEDFAKELNVTRGAVGNWERDKPIARKSVEAIANRWGLSTEWLLAGRGRAPGEAAKPLDGEALAAMDRHEKQAATHVAEMKREAALPRPGAVRYKDV